ncbi:aspartate carbamoyltransferase regulatory subunit [Clostridium gasigenes]|uniref:aspartate carbamoyltransferase regulatory subunit n=1 Tax=Clostridium gasigenes TaxID=94869 RepID=UPI001438452D|nr:aspartate carbamoyltransferase regulatory subunit [Clostridium gasigenes]NKF08121.1 aspartate carbamoyltransferase regulatory subunit [Clostridium gasigenes]QSW18526.1 aspartate carbamoyltransferase regulatory subunit [Clostridium gasigenes]
MLEITSIKNGLVIDHIEAGMGVKIFRYLNLDKRCNQVALIINAESKRLGKKDIIKIEDCMDIDYTILSLLSPNITINEVRNEKRTKKIKPELPKIVENILKCNNPRCITGNEKYVAHTFKLVNCEKGTYRCEYCDHIMKLSEVIS